MSYCSFWAARESNPGFPLLHFWDTIMEQIMKPSQPL